MPLLIVPQAFSPSTGGETKMPLEGATVAALLQRAVDRHPDMRRRIYTSAGTVASWNNLYVGDEHIRHLQGLDTPLEDADVVSLLNAVAGG